MKPSEISQPPETNGCKEEDGFRIWRFANECIVFDLSKQKGLRCAAVSSAIAGSIVQIEACLKRRLMRDRNV